ncbi:unnamed protein product [Heligmosomoides polygyrus]|uniref:DRBM domain-containing protein n=1 Tax=Heligmosomoides polygyrus TaxID=6339 RepID=A0A183GEN6_HELPZ|nr:unnamed protein product [Heligmosomoides polygyrus]
MVSDHQTTSIEAWAADFRTECAPDVFPIDGKCLKCHLAVHFSSAMRLEFECRNQNKEKKEMAAFAALQQMAPNGTVDTRNAVNIM